MNDLEQLIYLIKNKGACPRINRCVIACEICVVKGFPACGRETKSVSENADVNREVVDQARSLIKKLIGGKSETK